MILKQNALLFGSCLFMSYRLICIKIDHVMWHWMVPVSISKEED